VKVGSFSNYCVVANGNGTCTSMLWSAVVVADPTNLFTATVLSNNPIGYWRLNEASGNTVANDYAGGANGVYGASTVNGLPGVPAAGIGTEASVMMYNRALTPAAGSVTNAGVVLNTNTVTMLCWVNPSTSTETNPSGIFFCRTGSTVAGDQTGSGNVLDYTWNGLPATYNYGSGLTMPANVWSLAVMTTTPTNTILYVFNTNGVASATNNVSNAVQSFYGGVAIGADTISTNRIFQGEISEAALFNYTLSAAQLQQLYYSATNGLFSSSSGAPKIAFTRINGNQLGITWPSSFVGSYYLQVQTNPITIGLSNDWVPYNGSPAATINLTGVTNTLPGGKISVFYRLAP
jgi:hypothetical protein